MPRKQYKDVVIEEGHNIFINNIECKIIEIDKEKKGIRVVVVDEKIVDEIIRQQIIESTLAYMGGKP